MYLCCCCETMSSFHNTVISPPRHKYKTICTSLLLPACHEGTSLSTMTRVRDASPSPLSISGKVLVGSSTDTESEGITRDKYSRVFVFGARGVSLDLSRKRQGGAGAREVKPPTAAATPPLRGGGRWLHFSNERTRYFLCVFLRVASFHYYHLCR